MSLYYSASAQSTQKPPKPEFVGLSNQGATCYMNSLLQTLFMTPDFRNEIYKWQYDPIKHGDPEDCIPLQLQILFGKLQLAESNYVETTGLTKSFQWDLRESFQQHDVQEFCRVLFDAIEQSMAGTDQANVINDLYQGTYIDYVKCLNCKRESQREDRFLDVSLTVRNEFEKIYNKSVEMALENYVKREELTGENKYYCDFCRSKNDAEKGLKLQKLPKILVMQLKRFDLDLTTLQRIKLNDRVTFPEILNMNPFTNQKSENFKRKNDQHLNKIQHIQDLEIHTIQQSQDKRPFTLENFLKKRLSGDNSYYLRCEKQKLIERFLEDGKNVYELFSIMIHSGSALGGHYYAYIKIFENSKWYCFNDSTVTEISADDIPKVYGGNSQGSSISGLGSYSANAYLLMYRRIEVENINKIEKSQVPGYIHEFIEEEKNKLAQELLEKEEKLKSLKIKFIFLTQEKYIEIKKDATIKEFTKKAIDEFKLDNGEENIRIRGYSSYYETFQEVYEDEKTVDESGIYTHKVLSLEIKSPEEKFLPYDPTKLIIKVHVWQSDDLTYHQLISNPKMITIEKKESLRTLMKKIEENFKIPYEKQMIIRKSFNGTPEILSTSNYINQSLSYARIFEGTVLYVEYQIGLKSKWVKILEEEQGKISIKFNDPNKVDSFTSNEFFNFSLSIDSQKTVLELKQEIAKRLKISPDNFFMKKSGSFGSELRDFELRLSQASIFNNTQIYVEFGQSSKPDEFRVNFQIALPPKSRDSDGEIYSVESLFEIPVNMSLKIIQIKEIFCSEFKARYPTADIVPQFVRFRQNSYSFLGKVLGNKEMLKEYKTSEKLNFCVEFLQSPEKVLENSDLIIYCKIWYPNTWELSKAFEIIINKNSKIHDLGAKISNVTEIEPLNLEITSIISSYNYQRIDLLNETFIRTYKNYGYISGKPLFINANDSLVIVKDCRQNTRPMTIEEKEKYLKVSKFNSKEKSIKITVKKKHTHEEAKEKNEFNNTDSSIISDTNSIKTDDVITMP